MNYNIEQLLADYRLAWLSRHISLITRREVMSGNAKFGAFGDGKELAQIALAHAVQPGDVRSGYYRDQTFMLACGALTPQQFFAQLYGHTDPTADPASSGRMMNAHFATRMLDPHGKWHSQIDQINSAADISPTGGQMPRLVGLAYASRLYRELPELHSFQAFSRNGNEIAWGMIGNASCAEGIFWEALNAIGLLRVPAIISVWDDWYGISVPNEKQFAKTDLSELVAGFAYDSETGQGLRLVQVRGWDYPALRETYAKAACEARERHIPTLVHVTELTQPQGHSTSGSHERYKPPERLAWERDHDPLPLMRQWLLAEGYADAVTLDQCEQQSLAEAEQARQAAWDAHQTALHIPAQALAQQLEPIDGAAATQLHNEPRPSRRGQLIAAHTALLGKKRSAITDEQWYLQQRAALRRTYSTHLYREDPAAALHVPTVPIADAADAAEVPGYEIMRATFDAWLERDPRVCIFGEDVGTLGDVNQGTSGLQAKYGPLRITDTGIREATIIGQAIGMALRGLRPIAEIQYLDYILYAMSQLSDDLASLHWRTAGGQIAPVIVRTRGHRLEGVWHSGSPMGTLVHALRGMHILVPRDMTRAAGFYNTLLQADEPALIVEVLNGYRLRERLPQNIGKYTISLGTVELLRPGTDLTLATYGACCRIALAAAEQLAEIGIQLEVIDVQSLLPFDITGEIGKSLAKTGRLLIVDEDVPGGASAYMLQQIIEVQGGYWHLDAPPRTLTAQAHRPAYTSDGDYASKPNAEDIVLAAIEMMQ
jgi:pyruvate/2-oxoglutarate/acetoin dehydrogenase E1 component/TPP-dependent pyruvate/acetoin dehydrogenase alpha subunit